MRQENEFAGAIPASEGEGRGGVNGFAGYASIVPAIAQKRVRSHAGSVLLRLKNARVSGSGPEASIQIAAVAEVVCGWRFCGAIGRSFRKRLPDLPKASDF